jgi:hypothetical protein
MDVKSTIDSFFSGHPIPTNSLIIQNHLAQMKLFGVRQGIELLPTQDSAQDDRLKFIQSIYQQNKIDTYLDDIWEKHLCLGKILFYLRPNKRGSYTFSYYDKTQFRDYYDEDGVLNEVVIIYSYNKKSRIDNISPLKAWVKIRITDSNVWVTKSEGKPGFENEFGDPGKTEEYVNSLGFIPCVVCRNKPHGVGAEGEGEFDALAAQIELYEEKEAAMAENLSFFGNPSLVTTRSPQETTEAMGGETPQLMRNRTLSSAAGWYGSSTSTRNQDPFSYRGGAGIKVRKVIGNVQPDERFGYIAPDPITPDHALYVREQREALHYALGGIDERGISTNATAYELKSIYGRLATTAMKKCKQLYTHGLCKLFEMAVFAEEELFRRSLSYRLKKKVEDMTDGFITDLLEKNKIPDGVFGLIPVGSREVYWRFTGPVFESSVRDMHLSSIVARNLQELGVRSLDALRTIFEDKTDKELKGMLEGGYPFRYMSAIANTTGQMINLYQSSLQIPSQEDTNLPLGAFLPIQPLIDRSIKALYKELSYGPDFDSVKPGDPPVVPTGESNYVAATIADKRKRSDATPAESAGTSDSISSGTGSLSAAGIYPVSPEPNPGESLEGRIQLDGELPEFTSDIPLSGSTVSTTQFQPKPAASSRTANIPPDLAVDADKPGSVWSQLFPNFTAATAKLKPKRRVRNK